MSTEAADALLARHQKMLARSVQGDLPVAEITGFVAEIAAAGATTPPGSSRDALRDILYFWAGDLANRGERSRDAPLPKLAPFTAAPPPEPAAEASLPQPPAPSRSAEPALTDNIEREARARSILRLAAFARQWRTTKDPATRRGYLLSGKALTEASLYVDEDADIRALVEASQAAAERRKRYVSGAFITLLMLAFGCAMLVLHFADKQKNELQHLKELQAKELELQQERLASSGFARERNDLREGARRAVDAFELNKIEPLRIFLQKVGDATPDEVARLRLDPPPAGSILDIASQKQRQKTAWASPPRQAGATDNCNGFLWLGSTSDSRLADKRDPAALKPGESVALDNRSDLRLRVDWPNQDTYMPSRQNGLVPAGAVVTVTGETRQFREGQIWAPVSVPREYCTTAFLQYVGPASATEPVLAALHQLGIQTPPAEQVDSAKGLAEVRYFWPEDQVVSERAAAALRGALPGRSFRLVPLTNFRTKPRSGTIEIWLDLGG